MRLWDIMVYLDKHGLTIGEFQKWVEHQSIELSSIEDYIERFISEKG